MNFHAHLTDVKSKAQGSEGVHESDIGLEPESSDLHGNSQSESRRICWPGCQGGSCCPQHQSSSFWVLGGVEIARGGSLVEWGLGEEAHGGLGTATF